MTAAIAAEFRQDFEEALAVGGRETGIARADARRSRARRCVAAAAFDTSRHFLTQRLDVEIARLADQGLRKVERRRGDGAERFHGPIGVRRSSPWNLPLRTERMHRP
jgi:hypothetical protein